MLVSPNDPAQSIYLPWCVELWVACLDVVSAIARRDVLSTGKPPEIVKDERLHDRDAGPPTETLGEPAISPIQSEQLIDMAPKRDPTVAASEPPVTLKSEVAEEGQICYREGGALFAEDVEQHMALLPEVVSTTDEVTIEDIWHRPSRDLRRCQALRALPSGLRVVRSPSGLVADRSLLRKQGSAIRSTDWIRPRRSPEDEEPRPVLARSLA
ncbi:unnamed protein product [Phytophthora fragariaefolia]|uniref:Unnamed protein product n=1 Tax=Phytophthora fragariaefolia TaxID=1490495 RepID=A0A9W6WXH5_9STRA|nr:unnamed protein product [Phytophthora fragariaefolia]